MTRRKIFFDGGCRPNPGMMEAAAVTGSVTYHWPDLGHGTNTEAEWLALLHALRLAHDMQFADFDLIGDSAVVIAQATGAQRCRDPRLQGYRDRYAALAALGAPARIRYIGRAQNLAGIALARVHGRR